MKKKLLALATVAAFASQTMAASGQTSYVVIQKMGPAAYSVSHCQLQEVPAQVACVETSVLKHGELGAVEQQILKKIKAENLETGLLVSGGVVVGVVALGAAGLFIGAPVAVAAASAAGVGSSFDAVAMGIVASTALGAGLGGTGGYVASQSTAQLIFKDHQSLLMIDREFQMLIQQGRPLVIHSTETAAGEISNLILQSGQSIQARP